MCTIPTSTIDIFLPGGASALKSSEFNVKQYVNTLRQTIPLPQLCTTLNKEVGKVKNALVDVVNSRYNSVVKLSNDLRDISEYFPSIKTELLTYLSLCSTLSADADNVLNEVQNLLKAHEDLIAAKSKEEVFLMMYRTVKTNLTHIQNAKHSQPSARLCLFLELIAGDVQSAEVALQTFLQISKTNESNMLNTNSISSENSSIEIVWNTLDSLTKELRVDVLSCLTTILKIVLQSYCASFVSNNTLNEDNQTEMSQETKQRHFFLSGDRDADTQILITAATHLASAFLILGEEQKAQEIFKNVFVDHVIEKALHRVGHLTVTPSSSGNINTPIIARTISREDTLAVDTFLTIISNEISKSLHSFFRLTKSWESDEDSHLTNDPQCHSNKMSNRVSHLNLIPTCCIFPILTTLELYFPSCFVPIYSNLYFRNFKVFHDLIDTICQFMSEKNTLQFRQSKTWLQFTLKWRTQAFEAGRQQQLLSTFNKELNFTLINDNELSECSLHITNLIVQMIRESLSTDYIIQREFPKILRFISEVLLVHFKNYLNEFVLQHTPAYTNPTLSTIKQPLENRDFMGFMISDILKLERLLLKEVEGNFVEKALYLNKQPKSCQTIYMQTDDIIKQQEEYVIQTFSIISNGIIFERQKLERLFLSMYLDSVHAHLLAMKGVPPVYRMTNRAVTGQPSLYVEASGKTIQSFIFIIDRMASKDKISAAVSWIPDFIDQCILTFCTQLEDVLSAVQLQEKSLKRLQKGKTHQSTISLESSNGSSIQDKTKIYTQLRIDAEAFLSVCNSAFLKLLPSLPDPLTSPRQRLNQLLNQLTI